ncbi:MAG: class I SAM-dependent methyltransferase [Candidatus Caldarchaeum sp.]
MTEEEYRFVQAVAKPFPGSRVLEVGSRNINGTIRPIFQGCEYLGIDLYPGEGVDLVMDAEKMAFPDGFFDGVVSTSTLEHVARIWMACEEMQRVLKRGGWIIVTCCGIAFPQHDYPQDYWRITLATWPVLFPHIKIECAFDLGNNILGMKGFKP